MSIAFHVSLPVQLLSYLPGIESSEYSPVMACLNILEKESESQLRGT